MDIGVWQLAVVVVVLTIIGAARAFSGRTATVGGAGTSGTHLTGSWTSLAIVFLASAAAFEGNRAALHAWYGIDYTIGSFDGIVAFGVMAVLVAALARLLRAGSGIVTYIVLLLVLVVVGPVLHQAAWVFVMPTYWTIAGVVEAMSSGDSGLLNLDLLWGGWSADIGFLWDEFASTAGRQLSGHLEPLLADPSNASTVLFPQAVVALLALRFARRGRPSTSFVSLNAASYGGVLMDSINRETTRLAGASALLNGSGFRRWVIGRLTSRHKAISPEIGLDLRVLAGVSAALERREVRYELAFLALVGLAAISALAELPVPLGLAVLGIVGTYLWKSGGEHFRLASLFAHGQYDPEELERRLRWQADARIPDAVTRDGCNVIVYDEFSPFSVAGTVLESFSFSVDVARPAPGASGTRMDVDEAILYNAVENSLLALGIRGLTIEDCLLVHGGDLAGVRALLPEPLERPRQRLEPDEIKAYIGQSDSRIRHYKWIKVQDWGGELIVSYFLRVHLEGNALYIEVTHCVLLPLAERHRTIDTLLRFSLMSRLGWLQLAILKSPFAAVIAVPRLLSRARGGLWRALGLDERATRRAIRLDPRYSYGVGQSIRSALASGSFVHYFQRMDSDLYSKSIPYQIVQRAADALEALGVDVSVLREGQTTIINSGVMVQGGNVTAQSLAVGDQARASVGGKAKSLIQRATQARPKAA